MNLSRAQGKLHSLFNSPMYRVTWTDNAAQGFPHLQSKTVALLTKEFNAHSGQIRIPNQCAILARVPSSYPAKAGKLIHNSTTTEYSIQSKPSSKPKQRIQTTMELILQPHLGREPSQQSCPTVLSQRHTSLLPSSGLKQLPCLKIGPNSKSYLPKNINSRHIQKADWWTTVSAKANLWHLEE